MNTRNPYENQSRFDAEPSVVDRARDERWLPVWAGRIVAATTVVTLSALYIGTHDLPDILKRDHYIAPQDPTEDILGIPSNG